MRPRRSSNTLHRILVKLGILICLAVLSVFVYNFKVNKTCCRQDGHECDSTNTTLSESIKDTRFIFFSKSKALKLFRAHPLNQDINIQYLFPATICVNLDTYKRLVTLSIVNLSDWSPPDSGPATPSALIRARAISIFNQNLTPQFTINLTPAGRYVSSDKPNNITANLNLKSMADTDKLTDIYHAIQQITDAGINYNRLHIDENYIYLQLLSETFAIIDLKNDSSVAIASLHQLLAQSTITLEGMFIDLRFNYPVIAPINKP